MPDAFPSTLFNALAGTLAVADAPAPSAAAPAPDSMGWFMPPAGSTFADEIDWAMNFINGVTIFFFVLVVVLMVWFALRYRRRDPRQRALAQTSHNTPLEIGWSVPPLIIVLYMFWLGIGGFMTLTTIPEDGYLVEVEADKWTWRFIHENGRTDVDVLHVPAGEPVRLRMNSRDVLHSTFIPAFRVQQDVVPGRYTWLWFEATAPTPGAGEPLPEGEALDEMIRGRVTDRVRARLEAEGVDAGDANPSPSPELERAVAEELEEISPAAKRNMAMEIVMERARPHGHVLYCAEYCGTLHSQMSARVVVHEPGWRPPPPDIGDTPEERGRFYFEQLGCAGCHQTGPDRLPSHIGPAFTGRIYGTTSPQLDDPNQVVDDNFLRRSILNPQAQVKTGFQPVMPPFGHLDEDQVRDLIAYLRSIGGDVPAGYEAN